MSQDMLQGKQTGYNHNLKFLTPTKELSYKQLKHTAVITHQPPPPTPRPLSANHHVTCNMYLSIRVYSLEFHSLVVQFKIGLGSLSSRV